MNGGYCKQWNISSDFTVTRVLGWEISPSISYALKTSLHNKSSAPIVSFAPISKMEDSQSNESDFIDFQRKMKKPKKGFCLQYTYTRLTHQNENYLSTSSFRVSGGCSVGSLFLLTSWQILENKVIAHNILNKEASCSYPPLAFYRQALKIFEIHIRVFITLISPFLKTKDEMSVQVYDTVNLYCKSLH